MASVVVAVPAASASPNSADPGDDPLACPDDATATAAKALHFAGTADFWIDRWHHACRLDPDHPDRAIVALTYIAGEERTGQRYQGDSLWQRDLDVVVIDLSNDAVLAHRHEDKAVEDGGERLEGIAIDTGRYVLAAGKRAFGVRVSNGTHCSCANLSVKTLTLYLQNGKRLDRLLSTGIDSDQAGYEQGTPPPPTCTSIATARKTTIAVGKSKSHGLADLLLTTIETPTYDVDEDSSKCEPLSPKTRTKRLRYDGKVYQ